MGTTTVRFEQVKVRIAKRHPCPVCRKPVSRQTTIIQTVNPFNTHNGVPKSREQVREDCLAEAAKWKAKPEPCSDCKAIRKMIAAGQS